mmetsp:Transcript_61103/g.69227  ORF Transcript_61103/g.69227 Transcript_61103/m.69227 type:complete len:435 (+) Transcript_61103:2-1306(+)
MKNTNRTVVILTTVILLLFTNYIPSSYSLTVATTTGGAFRKSTLLSWDGKVALGHCVEERSSSSGYDGISTLRITTINHDDDDDDGSSKHKKENDDDKDTATNTAPLVLHFPEKEDTTGSLASQHCMSAFASAILTRSSNFQAWMAEEGKTIVELGSGRGAAGVAAAAAAKSSHCVLTEYDDEAIQLLQETIQLNQENALLQATTLTTDFLDWREDYNTDNIPPVDLVVGSDIAYYYHLLRPIMDTSRTFMDRRRSRGIDTDNTNNNTNNNDDNNNNNKKKNDQVDNTINSNKSFPSTSSSSSSSGSSRRGSSLFVVGQANRQSQLDLFTNIKNGCYNQLTDQQDPPWTGTTTLLLYQLQISEFCTTLLECDATAKVDGVIPISVIVHHDNDNDDDTENDNDDDDSVTKLRLRPFDHYAYEVTEEECENIPKTF